ncbi:MAG: alpha-amylase family glycosyl hydrolase [Cyanobacteria bacterium P01_A01_bin.17]
MDKVASVASSERFVLRVKPLVESVYGPLGVDVDEVCDRIQTLLSPHLSNAATDLNPIDRWSQDDVLLITYGDSILRADQKESPLSTLHHFLSHHLQDVITGVHILPFFPYSSDDGFAVIDYLQVNPELGDWSDIGRIAEPFDLMTDLVMNHVSSQSQWFQQFTQGQPPGCDYFIAIDPETDVSGVVRPRNTALLCPVETPDGTQHVWATFGHDQIDLNFANPDVLLEFIGIILHYLNTGTKLLRLDAIGYLWKNVGSPCIHLRETHTLIKLIREIVALVKPDASLVTETNVPNRENLSYFGNRNEAHLIYNFSLPPLVVNALLQERSDHLKTWMMSMPPAPLGCAYFNFTASHDGMGMRPTEGLLEAEEYETFLRCMKAFGGEISMRAQADGSESPYEVNISLFDAMKGTAQGEDEWQIPRFLCSQTIMMSLEGIPAFYIHSLLATPNDHEAMQRTGRKRSINRHQWDYDHLLAQLQTPDSAQFIVLRDLSRLIQLRRQQPAFHPNATQYTLHLQPALFGFWRQSIGRDQSIFSIHNLTPRPQVLNLRDINLIGIDPWFDLISDTVIPEGTYEFSLPPYQSAWITNKMPATP